MASPAKMYQREMHENLGFFATWLPADQMEIGDVGVLDHGRFRRVTTLTALGIPHLTQAGTGRQKLEYSSTEGTTIKPSVDAGIAAVAKAEIAIDFSRAGAFVFHVSQLLQHRLAAPAAVGAAVVGAFRNGDWKKEWLLVESLHTAPRATIIVAQSNAAGITLEANVNGPLGAVSLVDPKLGLTVASTRGTVVHIIGGTDVHPLYSCMRLDDPIFGDTSLQPVRGPSSHVPFTRPSIEELLES